MANRLKLQMDDLTVDSFVPVEPVAMPGAPVFVEWTGCDSACTQCGGGSGFDCGGTLEPQIRIGAVDNL